VSSSGLSGESPMASVNTARNGGAMHDPIPIRFVYTIFHCIYVKIHPSDQADLNKLGFICTNLKLYITIMFHIQWN
jgi:hypothetical protein